VELIRHLTKEGYRVATVKCTNKPISLDTKGKDTWRHHAAGAVLVVLSSARETDFLVHTSITMSEILRTIATVGCYDLVLVEGANSPDIPKIQIGTCRKRKHTVASYENNLNEIVHVIKKEIESRHLLQQLTICVNGKNIPLTEFPEHILTNTIVGMLSSLKGVRTIKDATITLKR
jgi:molybdopterin-guanine dinucleotide biosynthesis protein MobB